MTSLVFVSDDNLLGLNILTSGSETNRATLGDVSALVEGNCFRNNTSPMTQGETRSFLCEQPIRTKSLILFKNKHTVDEEVLLHLCEVQVYEENDVTDIPEASWTSEWLPVTSQIVTHSLGRTPVYGRLLIESTSGETQGFVYTDVHANDEYAGVTLKYSDQEVVVTVEDDSYTLFCPDSDSWMFSKPICDISK